MLSALAPVAVSENENDLPKENDSDLEPYSDVVDTTTLVLENEVSVDFVMAAAPALVACVVSIVKFEVAASLDAANCDTVLAVRNDHEDSVESLVLESLHHVILQH